MVAAELFLRLIGVAMLVLLSGIVLRARPRHLQAKTLAGLAGSVGAFLLTSMPHADALFGPLIYPLTALCSTHPVWFWLASAAMFSDIKRLNGIHLASLAAMACMGVLYQSVLPPHGMRLFPEVQWPGTTFGLASLMFA